MLSYSNKRLAGANYLKRWNGCKQLDAINRSVRVDFGVTHPTLNWMDCFDLPYSARSGSPGYALKEIDVWQPDHELARPRRPKAIHCPTPIFPSSGKANRLREITTYYQRATLARQTANRSALAPKLRRRLPVVLSCHEQYDALDQQTSLSQNAQHNLTVRDIQNQIANLARRLTQNRQQLNDIRVCANSFARSARRDRARLRRVVSEASESILSDPPDLQ
jgi:hypothetical protein